MPDRHHARMDRERCREAARERVLGARRWRVVGRRPLLVGGRHDVQWPGVLVGVSFVEPVRQGWVRLPRWRSRTHVRTSVSLTVTTEPPCIDNVGNARRPPGAPPCGVTVSVTSCARDRPLRHGVCARAVRPAVVAPPRVGRRHRGPPLLPVAAHAAFRHAAREPAPCRELRPRHARAAQLRRHPPGQQTPGRRLPERCHPAGRHPASSHPVRSRPANHHRPWRPAWPAASSSRTCRTARRAPERVHLPAVPSGRPVRACWSAAPPPADRSRRHSDRPTARHPACRRTCSPSRTAPQRSPSSGLRVLQWAIHRRAPLDSPFVVGIVVRQSTSRHPTVMTLWCCPVSSQSRPNWSF